MDIRDFFKPKSEAKKVTANNEANYETNASSSNNVNVQPSTSSSVPKQKHDQDIFKLTNKPTKIIEVTNDDDNTESNDCMTDPNTSSLTTKSRKRKLTRFNYDATYDKKRLRLVLSDWLTVFPWLRCNNERTMMWCHVCRTHSKIADTTSNFYKETGVKGTSVRRSSVESHASSKRHRDCERASFAKENPQATPLAKLSLRMTEEQMRIMSCLFNTAYYCATEELAFTKYPTLLSLQIKNGLSIGNNYKTDKMAAEFTHHISEVLKDDLKKQLVEGRFLTIMADESTDCTVISEEIVYVRIIKKGKPITNFVGLMESSSGNAEGILEAINRALGNIGVDNAMLKKKLVCINLDGAAVNMGSKNGVAAMIKRESPHVIAVHCIAHNLELAVGDSLKSSPYIKGKFEEVLNGIVKLYQYSPKLKRQFKEIAEILKSQTAHMGKIKQIRWVASQQRTVSAILQNYNIIVMHLEDVANGKTDQAAKCKGYLKEIKSVKFLKTLHILLDILNILSPISKKFQNDELLIVDIASSLETVILKLEELKSIKSSHFLEFRNAVNQPDNNYKGVKLTGNLDDLDQSMLQLVSVVTDCIEKRFNPFFKDKPMSLFHIFDFSCWPMNKADLVSYGVDELSELVKHFSHILTKEESKQAQEEWLTLKVIVNKMKANNCNKLHVYRQLLASQPPDLINVLLLINIMFCISPSTSACERGFSTMNRLKRVERSNLSHKTLNSIMRISIDGPTLEDFNPNTSIKHWLTQTKGTRHIHGHALPASASHNQQDDSESD